jgi:hypothetical protein
MPHKPREINKLRILTCCGAALAGLSGYLLARTITVDDNGPADFSSIQAAINAAVAGDVVSVAAGTYNENLTFKSGVSVIGAGSSVTIVDGRDLGSVGRLINCDSSTRVSGFTFRNGSAQFGGGLFITGGAPVITRNRITGNRALAAPGGLYYYYGGGLEVYYSDGVITDNEIDSNIADIGGGAELFGGKPVLTLNRINGNTAGATSSAYSFGGGVEVSYGDAIITDNTFSANRADSGAGLDVFLGSPQVLRNQFLSNFALTWGGGLAADVDSGTLARISRNRFESNQALLGGGLAFLGPGSPLVSNNLVLGNQALRQGGDHSYGGGIAVDFANATLVNNTLVGNEADFGGGVMILTSRGPTVLTNNILQGNIARAAGTQSGAALLDGSGLEVLHNIFHGNVPGNCGGGNAIQCGDPSNLLLDPLFLSPPARDYRLQAGSPAIDSASATLAPRDDFRGQRRPLDGNRNGVAIADRGAYEFDRNDVLNLRFQSASTMTWDAAPGATQYHLYSGSLATLASSGIDVCRDADDPNRSDLLFAEARIPSAGAGFAYLVTAVVGTEQSPGWNSLGLERSLPAPCP